MDSKAALRAVVEQAIVDHSGLKTLNVVELPSSSTKFALAAAEQTAGHAESFSSEEQEETQRACELIDDALDELQLAGVRAAGAVELSNRKTEIADTAARWDADLVGVGAHDRSALA